MMASVSIRLKPQMNLDDTSDPLAIGRREPTGCTANTSPTRKRVHAFSAWRWNALACASGLYWYVFICRSPKPRTRELTPADQTASPNPRHRVVRRLGVKRFAFGRAARGLQ